MRKDFLLQVVVLVFLAKKNLNKRRCDAEMLILST